MKKVSLVVGLACVAQGAVAEGVASRMERSHEAAGVTVGDFVLKPKVTASVGSSDNIYATSSNEKSDVIAKLTPEVQVEKNGPAYKLKGTAGLTMERYNSHDGQDTREPWADMSGSYRLSPVTRVFGNAGFAVNHEDRGNPDLVGTSVKPMEYTTADAQVGVNHRMQRVRMMGAVSVKNTNYENGYTSAGANVDNDARDRTEWQGLAQASYKINSRLSPFARVTVSERDYTRELPRDRSNTGVQADAGLMFRLKGVMGEVYAGSIRRDYTSSFKDVGEADYGAKLAWNMDMDTTFTANLKRSIEETTLANSSAFVQTAADVGVERALNQNWLVTGGLGVRSNDYRGHAFNQRNDDISTAKLGTKYYLQHNVAVGAEYNYINRESSVNGGDYTRNLLLGKLSYAY